VPIIASETLHIDALEDNTIQIQFLNDLNHKRCIKLSSYTSDPDEKGKIYDLVKQLVGEKAINCDRKTGTCCISEEYFNFVDKMNELKK